MNVTWSPRSNCHTYETECCVTTEILQHITVLIWGSNVAFSILMVCVSPSILRTFSNMSDSDVLLRAAWRGRDRWSISGDQHNLHLLVQLLQSIAANSTEMLRRRTNMWRFLSMQVCSTDGNVFCLHSG